MPIRSRQSGRSRLAGLEAAPLRLKREDMAAHCSNSSPWRGVLAFLRGDPAREEVWRDGLQWRSAGLSLVLIVVGTAAFGATVGIWRSPLQALYTAIKLPLIVLLTTLGNGLLNGLLAPLLGVDLRIRDSLGAILKSHAVAAAILGSLSPVMLFMIWNVPSLDPAPSQSHLAFELIQLTHVTAVGFAGVAANLRLLRFLQRAAGGRRSAALHVLCAWLAGNLFLGAQLAWNFRPFIGAPALPVEFLRPNAFEGNFYETVLRNSARFFR